MRKLNVQREEYGDIRAWITGGEPMTVKELIDALTQMPPDVPVLRYCDWPVEAVEYYDGDRQVELK